MRSVALITSPRSGSTPVMQVLSHCLSLYNYGEIFNPNATRLEVIEGQLLKTDVPRGEQVHWESIDWSHNVERVKLLRAYAKKPCLVKVFCARCPDAERRWLMESFEQYFLERRDLFDQLLSYGIAASLNRWYQAEPLRAPPSIKLPRVVFDTFELDIFEYRRWREASPGRPVLFYEDFAKFGWHQILRAYDLAHFCTSLEPSMTPKQNLYEKKMAFLNLEEVTAWYRESTLQNFYPI